MSPSPSAAWPLLSTRYLVRDRYLTLRADRCLHPSGAIIDPYYVVEGPECAHVLAIDDENRIAMVKQYRYPINSSGYELPGGQAAPGEALLDCAKRELLEECGCEAENWRMLGNQFPDPWRTTCRLQLFIADHARIVAPLSLDPGEEIVAQFLPPAQVFDLMLNGGVNQWLHVGLLAAGFHALGWQTNSFPQVVP